MVRAWSFEQLLKVVRGTLNGLSTPLAVGGGHERALTPLLVLLLAGMVEGAFAGILFLLHLVMRTYMLRPPQLQKSFKDQLLEPVHANSITFSC